MSQNLSLPLGMNPFDVYKPQATQLVDLIFGLTNVPLSVNGTQMYLNQILANPILRSHLISMLSSVDPRAIQAINQREAQFRNEKTLDNRIREIQDKIANGRTYFAYVDSTGRPRLLDLEVDNSGSQESYDMAEMILRKNAW